MLNKKALRLKRTFDIVFSILGLTFCLPLFLCLIVLATIDTGAFGWYSSKRIGKKGKAFTIYKIRTMVPTTKTQSSVATSNNPNISSFGRFLRKTKLDELPQLFNVLFGNMSFVGPRPDVPGFADKLQGKDRQILQLRPGITGPASLKFKNEEALLAAQANPEHYNQTVIWPEKVRLNLEYLHNWSLRKDISYIFQTIF